MSSSAPLTNSTSPKEPCCSCPKSTYGALYSGSKYLKEKLIPLPHIIVKEIRSITNFCKFAHLLDISKEWSIIATCTKITSTLSIPGLICNLGDNIQSLIASGKKISQRLYSALKTACSLDRVVDGIASTLQILNKLKFVGSDAVVWIPYFKMIDFLSLVAELGFASETTHKVRMLNKALYSKENALEGKTEDQKIAILSKATEALTKIDLKRSLMVEGEEVRLPENNDKIHLKKRIIEVFKILQLPAPAAKEKKEALEDGEKILNGLKGRVKTILTRTCFTLANRVAIVVAAAFVTFPQFVFPLAVPILFPVGFAIFSCVGIVALALWGQKTFLISKDPFDKESKVPLQKITDSIQKSLSTAHIKIQAYFSQVTTQTATAVS